MLRKCVVVGFAFVLVMAGLISGTMAGAGAAAVIWGPAVLANQLGNPPNLAHPAVWTFIAVMIPGMIFGALGALYGVALPLSYSLGVRLGLAEGFGAQGALARWHVQKLFIALGHELECRTADGT